MLYAGSNVTKPDELKKVDIPHFFNAIKNPRPDIKKMIKCLRQVRTIDSKGYAAQKKLLPYVVCASFNPAYRKKENFNFIEYFIVDIDHIEAKGYSIDIVRKKVEADCRTLMCFLSPSEDGLKVLFKLKDRCTDPGLYSIFYKNFTTKFAKQFELEQVVDGVTCDVSRACFISYDPDAYLNEEAETINMKDYVDEENTIELTDTYREIVKEAEAEKKQEKEEREKDPDIESINKIKEILNLNKKQKVKPEIEVPEQLNDVMSDIKKTMEEVGITITDVTNINYGKKIQFKLGLKTGEVNLFYGKKGFSVVRTNKRNTTAELTDIGATMIETLLSI